MLFSLKKICLALLPVRHENTELKIVLRDKIVPSTHENEFVKNVPFSINESILGVKDSFCSP